MSGPTPDVRVTFSADNDPVARAIRELSSQLQKVKQDTDRAASSTGGLTAGVSRLTGALGQLGIAFGAAQVLRFVKDAIDAADQIQELSQKTGIGAERLSIFGFAAKQAGSDTRGLETGIRFLNRATAEAVRGNVQAAEAFEQVGISVKELRSLSPDEVFLRVANGLQRVPEGAERTHVALRLLGRTGTDLIPTLNALAGQGFANVAREAREAGAIISDEMARSADELNDSLERLKSSAQGLARGLVTPEATDRVTQFLENTKRELVAIDELVRSIAGFVRDGRLTGRIPITAPNFFDVEGGSSTSAQKPAPGDEAGAAEAREQEVRALARLLSLGQANAAEKARALELEREITAELKRATSSDRRAELATLLNTLTSARLRTEREITDEFAEQARAAEAAAAREVLRAEAARRRAAAEAEAEAERARAVEAARTRGGFLDVEDFLKRRNEPADPLARAFPPPFQTDALKTLEAMTLATDAQVEAFQRMRDEQAAVIDGNELLGASIRDAIAADLAGFFRDGITEAESFGDAIVQLGATIARTISSIVSQLLAAKIVGGIAGLFSGGITGSPLTFGDIAGVTPGGGVIDIPGFATGGVVRGPGHDTSDTIPALLSPGEFIVRAAAVREIGVDVLDELNRGGDLGRFRRYGIRGYAGGGLVEGGGGDGGEGGRFFGEVALDGELHWKRVQHSPRPMLRALGANREAVKRELGL